MIVSFRIFKIKVEKISLHISQDEDELSHSTNVVLHRSCPLGLTMLLRPLVTVFWVRRCALSSFGHHVSKDMGHDAKPSQGQAPPLLQTTGIDAIKRRAKFYQAKHFCLSISTKQVLTDATLRPKHVLTVYSLLYTSEDLFDLLNKSLCYISSYPLTVGSGCLTHCISL